MEGSVADQYILLIDKHSAPKLAPGQKRLLLVDGHSSHFSRGFIESARALGIIILCYPPHCTHILQGLDVVSFAVAKTEWTKARDEYERSTGRVITKEVFLEVFSKAFEKAFTAKNNKKAFEKTGVHPFNRNAVKEEDLAPSLEHSNTTHLPFKIATPAKHAIHAYRALQLLERGGEAETDSSDEGDEVISGGDDDDEEDTEGDDVDGEGHAALVGESKSGSQ